MKKIVITIMALCLVFTASAIAADSPFGKGSRLIGGSASFSSSSGELYENGDGDGQTMISISPSFGQFVSPGVVVGGMFDITSWSQGDNDFSTFGFGPFVGYYVGADKTEIKGAVFPFVKAFFMYSSLDDATQTTFGVVGGIDYMLSTAVALQAGLQFSSDSFNPDGAGGSFSGTTLMLGAGIEAFVF